MGRSLGRLCTKLPSICFQKQKNRWKETQQGNEISFIRTMPSSWLQPALCMSATIAPSPSVLLQACPSPSITLWLLIYREPGTRSWVYCLAPLPHTHIHTIPMQMHIHLSVAAACDCLESRKSLRTPAKV